MEQAVTMETLLSNLNAEFEEQLTAEDLKKPLMMMKILLKMFERLGIDTDAVLQPPNERELNAHLPYYRDLVPVINVMRVFQHVAALPHMKRITINNFLQPSPQMSYSILMILFNLILFHQARLVEIAPKEEELFSRAKLVQDLEEQKNNLQEMLNNQAQEKAKRATRVEQMNEEILQLEEQLRLELQSRDQHKQDLDAIRKENEASQKQLDHKKTVLDNLTAEKERLQALRVSDADDVRSKAAQATGSVQEAEEKLGALGAVIAQRENSLKILQTMIKPNLDAANNLLEEIGKLKDYELGDLDSDSKDGELQMLNMTVAELKAQLAEVKARRDEGTRRRRDAVAKREQERLALESAIREAEEKVLQHQKFIAEATQRTQEIKEKTRQYEEEKLSGMREIRHIKKEHNAAINEWDGALIQLLDGVKIELDEKLSGVQD